MNIGQSFNALIIRSDVWKPIYQNLSDGNVLLGAQESGVYARNQWHFERQSDGSYIITSLQYGVQVHPLDGEITNPMQIILMVM